jgi:hypothetical protein
MSAVSIQEFKQPHFTDGWRLEIKIIGYHRKDFQKVLQQEASVTECIQYLRCLLWYAQASYAACLQICTSCLHVSL